MPTISTQFGSLATRLAGAKIESTFSRRIVEIVAVVVHFIIEPVLLRTSESGFVPAMPS